MINNSVLVGRLTKDPDLRYTSSGQAVATFTLAVNRSYTNQQGQREADFINCVVWRKQAENLANFAKKGALIGVVGRIQTRNYDNQQGQRVYVTEVVVDSFQMLEPRNTSEQRQQGLNNSGANNTAANNFNSGSNQAQSNQQSGNNGMPNFGQNNNQNFSGDAINISDDDLPF